MSSNVSSDNTKMSAAPAKTTKTAKATKATPVETAPAAAPAPVAAPVAAKTPRASKKTEAAAAPVAAPVPVATPVPVAAADPAADVAPAEDDVVSQLNSTIASLEEQIASLQTGLRAAVASVKSVQKLAARVVKKAGKRKGRKARDPSKPSEFEKPKQVTDELCSFLGVAKGTLITRADVTRGVTKYAKDRGLMNKQQIKPDAALRKLLGVSETDDLSILTLQKFLKHHYIKAAPAAV